MLLAFILLWLAWLIYVKNSIAKDGKKDQKLLFCDYFKEAKETVLATTGPEAAIV